MCQRSAGEREQREGLRMLEVWENGKERVVKCVKWSRGETFPPSWSEFGDFTHVVGSSVLARWVSK